jgi:site-specific DNA recombinase
MIAVYGRTSTRIQADNNGWAGQREAVHRWIASQGIDPATVVEYVDEGCTGRNQRRPQFQLMLLAVRAGKVQTIVAYSLSRLGRSTAEVLATAEELRKRKVRLVLVKEAVDMETPVGRMFLAILAAIAEFEADLTSERVRDGIAAFKAKGGGWGGSRTVDKQGQPIPRHRTRAALTPAEWQQWATRMEREGLSAEQVAKAIGVHPVTVRRRVRQPLC